MRFSKTWVLLFWYCLGSYLKNFFILYDRRRRTHARPMADNLLLNKQCGQTSLSREQTTARWTESRKERLARRPQQMILLMLLYYFCLNGHFCTNVCRTTCAKLKSLLVQLIILHLTGYFSAKHFWKRELFVKLNIYRSVLFPIFLRKFPGKNQVSWHWGQWELSLNICSI